MQLESNRIEAQSQVFFILKSYMYVHNLYNSVHKTTHSSSIKNTLHLSIHPCTLVSNTCAETQLKISLKKYFFHGNC